MKLPSLSSANLTHKTVLLRLDLNIEATDPALITSDFRIQTALPVLRDLMARQAKTVLLVHRGRPHGKVDAALSNAPLAAGLQAALGAPVKFMPHILSAEVTQAAGAMQAGEILMLENIRFDAREELNDHAFAAELAKLGDVFVNDAFANCHRAHASVDAITAYLPHYAGPLLLREVNTLSTALNNMARPTAAIIGGAKISTKLGLLSNLIDKMDVIFVGGAMANTFLVANGMNVQQSLIEPNLVPAASQILATAHTHNCQIILPDDALVARTLDDTPVAVPCMGVPEEMSIFDIGPATLLRLKTALTDCHTLVWNGPVGVFQKPAFAHGTMGIAQLIAERTRARSMTSIAGGGDTVAALQQAGVTQDFTYVSTAGGAFLEFMEGKKLPGLVALAREQRVTSNE